MSSHEPRPRRPGLRADPLRNARRHDRASSTSLLSNDPQPIREHRSSPPWPSVWGSTSCGSRSPSTGCPVQFTFARMLAGALVLAVIVTGPGGRLPRRTAGSIAHITIAALVGDAMPYLLFAIGEQTVGSALAGVLNATTPLGPSSLPSPSARSPIRRRTRLIGLAVGFSGALLILRAVEPRRRQQPRGPTRVPRRRRPLLACRSSTSPASCLRHVTVRPCLRPDARRHHSICPGGPRGWSPGHQLDASVLAAP